MDRRMLSGLTALAIIKKFIFDEFEVRLLKTYPELKLKGRHAIFLYDISIFATEVPLQYKLLPRIYAGNGFFYQLKDLITKGYVVQEESEIDARSTQIRITEKGFKAVEKIRVILEAVERQLEEIDFGSTKMTKVAQALQKNFVHTTRHLAA